MSVATLERVFSRHKSWVKSVAVSPDGTWVASGSDDRSVKIWDLETGTCRATLEGHTNRLESVAITPDGNQILSGGWDNTIRIWDYAERRQVASWKAGSTVFSVVAMSDSRRAISAVGWDLKVWDLTTKKCLSTLRGHSKTVASLALGKDQRRVISGSLDHNVRLWDLESGECLATLTGHTSSVFSVQITPDGRHAVSSSSDTTVKIWDLEAASCLGTLEGHRLDVISIALSPDGTLVASTGFTEMTARLWDWRAGKCLQVIETEGAVSPISVAFSPDGSRLVVGTLAGPIFVYRLTQLPSPLPAEPTRRYVNAKVVLLGEGTVGKTSLAHRLVEDEYVIRDRTHGMNVWRLDLPLPADETLEREALLWDLAGQEDYRLIHQLFLEETALALLLVNPQKDDPFAEAGDWLKALGAAVKGEGREVAKLLIPSQIDVGGPKVSDAKLDRFREEHGFAGWLPTSAKRGDNCSDEANGGEPSALKRLIAESIPWDRLPWTSTPRLLAEIKNAVVALRDDADIRLLRLAELTERLKAALPGERFGEPDVRTAVTLLANHGVVLPLKFGDLVLLRPDLLNGYAGAVIRAARAHKDEIGCVPEKDVYDPAFDFTGVDRLHRPDEELLLRALVQTLLDRSLCIAEETPEGSHLVFPSQYRRDRDIPREPDVFISYTFTGEWQTIYTTLVVRLWYSREFARRELWRNAAELETPKGHTLGLKIDKLGDGEATIRLFFDPEVPDELKVIFIEYVHRQLARYARDVRRDRRYVCANPRCRRPVTDLGAVRERQEAGQSFIRCQYCDRKVELIDFIEQRLASDPVARQVLGMEERAQQELDTQALEQILIGHLMAIAGEANQIFRPVTMFDYGIDGEIELKDEAGRASGKKVYVQLKSGASYLRRRKSDGREIFDVKNDRHLEYWVSQPVDVYLVIRDAEEVIRWMNVTRYLKERRDKSSRQIVFQGEKLDAAAVRRLRTRGDRAAGR